MEEDFRASDKFFGFCSESLGDIGLVSDDAPEKQFRRRVNWIAGFSTSSLLKIGNRPCSFLHRHEAFDAAFIRGFGKANRYSKSNCLVVVLCLKI